MTTTYTTEAEALARHIRQMPYGRRSAAVRKRLLWLWWLAWRETHGQP